MEKRQEIMHFDWSIHDQRHSQITNEKQNQGEANQGRGAGTMPKHKYFKYDHMSFLNLFIN